MPSRSLLSRLEPTLLALALGSPIPLLALAPDGPALLVTLLALAVPAAAIYGLYRLAIRGRPAADERLPLLPPPLGPPPAETRVAVFAVRRGGRAILSGTFDDVVQAARAGSVEPFDEVVGAGVVVAPAAIAELLPYVPSRLEARARQLYLAYLGVALGAASVGLFVLAAERLAGIGAGEGSGFRILLFALALVPLVFLRRSWKRLEAGRARGLVPAPPQRPSLGSASLDAALAAPVPATQRMLVLVVLVSAAAMLLPPEALQLKLAKDNEAIRNGEIWRLLTPGLVHGGAFHLFINALVLSHLGSFVERLLGSGRMLVVLWGGVFTGSLASFAMNPHPSVGVSGGLFALVGALLATGLRHRRRLPAPARRMLVRAPIEIIVLNLALGLSIPIIDNAAHMGGLAGGFLLGLVLGTRPALFGAAASPPAVGAPPDRPV
jgi:membrane associated rhomboid family serine protease